MLTARVVGFTPSVNGFAFSADELAIPDISISFSTGSTLALSDVVHALSGGMCFSAADYRRAAINVPSGPAPQVSDHLYNYLVAREIDSLNEDVILRILATMDPRVPEYSDSGAYTSGALTRAQVLLVQELPNITRDLNLGYLVQMCVVEQQSTSARELGRANRQVLAYAADIDAERCILHLYDPRYPNDDNVALTIMGTDSLSAPVALYYSHADVPVAGFFYVPYAAKLPPSA